METVTETPRKLPKKGVDFVTHAFDIEVSHLTKLREMVITMRAHGKPFYTQKKALGFAIELMYKEMSKHYKIEPLTNEMILEIQSRSEMLRAARNKTKDGQDEVAATPTAPALPSFEPGSI